LPRAVHPGAPLPEAHGANDINDKSDEPIEKLAKTNPFERLGRKETVDAITSGIERIADIPPEPNSVAKHDCDTDIVGSQASTTSAYALAHA
jgi:hypothetical protein